jgi:hypothetical protein
MGLNKVGTQTGNQRTIGEKCIKETEDAVLYGARLLIHYYLPREDEAI